jgi:putative FmdB family regulatory protein
MPVYEFSCDTCGTRFEEIRPSAHVVGGIQAARQAGQDQCR